MASQHHRTMVTGTESPYLTLKALILTLTDIDSEKYDMALNSLDAGDLGMPGPSVVAMGCTRTGTTTRKYSPSL